MRSEKGKYQLNLISTVMKGESSPSIHSSSKELYADYSDTQIPP
jgi:hypothetical protein